MEIDQFYQAFPEITDPRLLEQIRKFAVFKTLDRGQVLIGQGDDVAAIPLLLQGAIKVVREDESDKELLMYHIEPGESCVLSLASLLSFQKSKVTAVSDAEAVVMILPGNLVFKWMSEYEQWMTFVFKLFNKRLTEVMALVEAVTFRNADERLWLHLQKKARLSETDEVKITHQELAQELGTVREVVSRLLKELERRGQIQLFRGKIKLNLPPK